MTEKAQIALIIAIVVVIAMFVYKNPISSLIDKLQKVIDMLYEAVMQLVNGIENTADKIVTKIHKINIDIQNKDISARPQSGDSNIYMTRRDDKARNENEIPDESYDEDDNVNA